MDLWTFSTTVYARPGVEAACLALQDQHGMDVNVILWACWLATRSGPGPDEAALRAGLARLDDWNRTVTVPLRAVRRTLREPAADSPAVAAIRERARHAELEAEREAQAILQTIPCTAPTVRGADGVLTLLRSVSGHWSTAWSPAVEADLAVILAAADVV